MGEDTDGMVTSTSKLRDLIKGMTGFDIMEDEQTFKSIYDIIVGIGDEWQNLSDIDQAALLEALAGKRAGNSLAAALNNVEMIKDAYATAEGSAGSAMKEQENYSKSIQYSIDRLKASSQEWASDLISSDALKFFVDLGNAIVNVSDKFGSLNTIVAGGMFALGASGKFRVTNIEDLFSKYEASENVSTLLNKVESNPKMLNNQKVSIEGLAKAYGVADKECIQFLYDIRNGNVSLQSGQTYVGAFEKQMNSFGTKMKKVSSSVASSFKKIGEGILSGLLNAGISAAISLIITGVAKLVNSEKEMIENAKSATESFNEQKSSIDSYKSEIESLQDTMSDSTSSYDEVESARERLYEIQCGLIDNYGVEANGIDLVNKSLEEQSNIIDEINNKQMLDWENEVNKTSNAVKILNVAINSTIGSITSVSRSMQFITDLINGVDFKDAFSSFWTEGALDGNTFGSNLDKIKNKYEDFSVRIELAGNEEINTFIENLDNATRDQYGFYINGNADEVASEIEQIQNEFKDAPGYTDKFSQSLTDAYESASKLSDEISDTYNTAIANEVVKDDSLRKYYEDLADAYNNYNDAVVNGKDSSAELEKYSSIMNDILDNQDIDDSYKNYFKNLYSEMSNVISDYTFDVEIKPLVNDNKWNDELSEIFKSHSSDELIAFDKRGYEGSDLSEKQINVLRDLGSAAVNAGMSFEQLIRKYEESGEVLNKTDYAFKYYIDKFGIADKELLALAEDNKKLWIESARGALTADEAIRKFNKSIGKVDMSQFEQSVKDAKYNYGKELKQLKTWGISEDNAQKVKDGTLSTFGNVDMDKRAIINWSDELKRTYRKELDSWDYNPEVGSIDTVFGGSKSFNGTEIAFTPILQTENGAELLSRGSVYKYIHNIVEEATVDGKLNKTKLLELDAEGAEVGGKKIKGIIADIGDTAVETGKLMHFAGDYGAIELAKKELELAQQAYDFNESANRGAAINIDDLTTSVGNFAGVQSVLSEALSTQNGSMVISSEQLETLSANYENLDDAVEYTANGIVISTQKMSELNAEEKKSLKTNIEDKYNNLKREYEGATYKLAYYNKAIAETNSDDTERISILENQRDAIQSTVDSLSEQISEVQALDMAYNEATSTHNAFTNALNSANQGASYDSITNSLEQVQKLANAGKFGTDDIRSFVDYMTSTDMSNASVEEITAAYDNAMKMAKQFFTEGSEGSLKFVDLLKNTEVEINGVKKALATEDSEGNLLIDIKDMQQAAEATGYSVDFLYDNLNRLEEFGIDVEFNYDSEISDFISRLNELDKEIEETKKQIKDGTGDTDELKKHLNELKNEKVNIEATLNLDEINGQVDKVIDSVKKIKDIDAQINVAQNYAASTGGTVDSNALIAMQFAQSHAASSAGVSIQAALEMDTSDLEKKKAELESEAIEQTVDFKVSSGAYDSKVASIRGTSLEVPVTFKAENLTEFASSIKSKIQSAIDGIKPKNSGDGGAYGSANIGKSHFRGTVTGNAHANGTGNIGVRNTEHNVMVSEVKPEMVVDPHSGMYTIYNNPTMLDTLPKDAIVFNGDQTEQILRNGKSTTFGKAHANGTVGSAYTEGSKIGNYSADGSGNTGNLKKGKKSTFTGKNKETKDSSTNKEDTKNLVDWIERRLNVLQQKADRWAKTIETALNPSRIDKYYSKLESVYKKQIKTNFDGAERYLSKANSISLSSDLKNKVKSKHSSLFDSSGNLKKYQELIVEYDETTYKAIQDYQTWYDKYQSCIDSYIEATQNLANAPIEKAAKKIEILGDAIDVLEAKIDAKKVNQYKSSNNLIKSEMTDEKKILNNYSKANNAANKNMKSAASEAKKSGIKVKLGKELDLSKYQEGSTKYKKAVKYNAMVDAYKKANQNYVKAKAEYTTKMSELYKQQFDNIKNYYDKEVELIQATEKTIQEKVDLLEAKGQTVTSKYYTDQITYENKQIKLRQSEKKELEEQLKTMEKSGQKNTEQWYEAKAALADVNSELVENQKNIAELNKQVVQLANNWVHKFTDAISKSISLYDWAVNLMGNVDSFDSDTGKVSNEGLANLGSNTFGYNESKRSSALLSSTIKNLESNLSKGQLEFVDSNGQKRIYNSTEEMQKDIESLYEEWRSEISTTYDYETKIIDFMKKKYEAELSALKKLIDAKKDQLKAEQDLHNYQKQIRESTSDVSSIQKQIAALKGDSSEETVSKIQKLQKDLVDAQNNLQEQEYDRYISDQETMLDKLYEEYSDKIEAILKDTNALLKEGISLSDANQKQIDNTIKEYTEKYGYKDYTTNSKSNEQVGKSVPATTAAKSSASSGNSSSLNTNIESIAKTNTPSTTNKSTTSGFDSKVLSAYVVNANKQNNKKLESGDVVTVKKGTMTYSDPGLTKKYKKTSNAIEGIVKKVNDKKNGAYIEYTLPSGKTVKHWFKKSTLSGYSKGGIVKSLIPKGDDTIIAAKSGEGIMTPAQTQLFTEKLIPAMDEFISASDVIKKVNFPALNNVGNNDVTQNIELNLPNVTDPRSFVVEVQNNKTLQKAIQDISVGRINNNSTRLSVNKYK